MKTKETIETLSNNELQRIIDLYDYYKNNQEFYSVLLEEIQEVEDEVVNIKFPLDNIWDNIRKERKEPQVSKENILSDVKLIHKLSIRAIEELIQVIAVCKKYEKSIKVMEKLIQEKIICEEFKKKYLKTNQLI